MKKLFLIALLFVVALTLAACDTSNAGNISEANSSSGNSGNSSSNINPNTNEEIKVPNKEITNVTFANATYTYSGDYITHKITSTVPNYLTVQYEDNKEAEPGTYTAKAIVSGDGYTTKILESTFTIVLPENLPILDNALFRLNNPNSNYQAKMIYKINNTITNTQIKQFDKGYVKEEFNFENSLIKGYIYQQLSIDETYTWKQQRDSSNNTYYSIDRNQYINSNNDLLNESLPFDFSFNNLQSKYFTKLNEQSYEYSNISGIIENRLLNVKLLVSNKNEIIIKIEYINDSLQKVEFDFEFNKFNEVDFEWPTNLPTPSKQYESILNKIYSDNFKATYKLSQPNSTINKTFEVNKTAITEIRKNESNKTYYHVIRANSLFTYTANDESSYDKTVSDFTNYLTLMLNKPIDYNFFNYNNFELGLDENTFVSRRKLSGYYNISIEMIDNMNKIKITLSEDAQNEVVTELIMDFTVRSTITSPDFSDII